MERLPDEGRACSATCERRDTVISSEDSVISTGADVTADHGIFSRSSLMNPRVMAYGGFTPSAELTAAPRPPTVRRGQRRCQQREGLGLTGSGCGARTQLRLSAFAAGFGDTEANGMPALPWGRLVLQRAVAAVVLHVGRST